MVFIDYQRDNFQGVLTMQDMTISISPSVSFDGYGLRKRTDGILVNYYIYLTKHSQ
jgi:hypothetical protein